VVIFGKNMNQINFKTAALCLDGVGNNSTGIPTGQSRHSLRAPRLSSPQDSKAPKVVDYSNSEVKLDPKFFDNLGPYFWGPK
jgi:hypothetical protein